MSSRKRRAPSSPLSLALYLPLSLGAASLAMNLTIPGSSWSKRVQPSSRNDVEISSSMTAQADNKDQSADHGMRVQWRF